MKKYLISLFLLLLWAGMAEAAGFPEMMQGSTKVIINGGVYYGGLTGNFAVYNPDPDSTYGFDFSKFGTKGSCLIDSTLTPACFFLGRGASGQTSAGSGRLMTGRTMLVKGGDTIVAYETPVLYLGGINISGDVAGSGFDYLKLWGQSMIESGDSPSNTGAAWQIGNYEFNPEAQVVLSSDGFKQYHDKILALAGDGVSVNSSDFTDKTAMFLQADSASTLFTDLAQTDKDKFPDGKVWVVNGNLNVNSPITYYGLGTIIINGGDLTMEDGAQFLPADENSRLGIIVLKDAVGLYGNSNFSGGNKVKAMEFAEGTIYGGNYSVLTGSFVASDFNFETGASVSFQYDTIFDGQQPPGFRTLKLPQAGETGN